MTVCEEITSDVDSVNAGAVSMEVIDAKVRNLLRVRLTIPAVPKEDANKVMTSQPEQQKIAYEVASRSIVLLNSIIWKFQRVIFCLAGFETDKFDIWRSNL